MSANLKRKPETEKTPAPKRPHLRVVKDGETVRQSGYPIILMSFGTVVALIAAFLIYSQLGKQVGLTEAPWLNQFYALDKTLSEGGPTKFFQAKRALRQGVAKALEAREGSLTSEARQIAVYLFSDLLPNDDFEKDSALTLWTPLQRQIEEHAGTSGATFEQMQNLVWTYENPDRENPHLTPYAAQFLKIYRSLSRAKE